MHLLHNSYMTSLFAELANYHWDDTFQGLELFQTLQEEPVQLVLPLVSVLNMEPLLLANPEDLQFPKCHPIAHVLADTTHWQFLDNSPASSGGQISPTQFPAT